MADTIDPGMQAAQQTPAGGQGAPQHNPEQELARIRAELEESRTKERELQAQKEHWRTKAEKAAEEAERVKAELNDEPVSDEGRAIRKDLERVEAQLRELKDQQALASLSSQYPQLREREEEFKRFREDYPRTSVEKVAKLFLVENNLVPAVADAAPAPKGLERPSGGGRTAPSSGKLTQQAVRELRENNPRKYAEMLRSGALNPDNIE